jgi:hypothetical protein
MLAFHHCDTPALATIRHNMFYNTILDGQWLFQLTKSWRRRRAFFLWYRGGAGGILEMVCTSRVLLLLGAFSRRRDPYPVL